MALLPSGYAVGTTGNSITSPTEQLGGVMIGITTATAVTTGNPVTQTFNVRDTAETPNRRVVPVAASGAAHAFSTQKAYTSGTFAYNQSEFLIRTHADTINGVASNVLLINGNESGRLRRSLKQNAWGAKTSTAWRAGYFSFLRIAGQRTNWTTAPTANNATFKSTTNNGTDSSDEAIYVTFRSVPGELTYMRGEAHPFTDEYAAVTAS